MSIGLLLQSLNDLKLRRRRQIKPQVIRRRTRVDEDSPAIEPQQVKIVVGEGFLHQIHHLVAGMSTIPTEEYNDVPTARLLADKPNLCRIQVLKDPCFPRPNKEPQLCCQNPTSVLSTALD